VVIGDAGVSPLVDPERVSRADRKVLHPSRPAAAQPRATGIGIRAFLGGAPIWEPSTPGGRLHGFQLRPAGSPRRSISAPIDWDEPSGVKTIAYGQLLGQLWVAFDDGVQDLTGKVALSRPFKKANVDTDPTKFLHVHDVRGHRQHGSTLPRSSSSSDQSAPVQEALSKPGQNTLLVQPILGPSMRIEAQAIHGLVNGNPWDINNQAHEHRLIDYDVDPAKRRSWQPTESPFEHAGVDRMTQFDVYVSAQRLYGLHGRNAGRMYAVPG